jgi:hypothetical protein
LTGVNSCCILGIDTLGVGTDTKEGEAMKNHWLRGLVLGVSVALLLSGGVALAQSLHAWPECFQCQPRTEYDGEEGYPYFYNWESCGWEPGEPLYYRETFANGEYWDDDYNADEEGCVADGPWTWTCGGEAQHHSANATLANSWVWPDDFWGPFEICVSVPDMLPDQVSADQTVCDTILFAEVCEAAAEEFVPEPGTILLLGSGLAGLAGYAALRWRARE